MPRKLDRSDMSKTACTISHNAQILVKERVQQQLLYLALLILVNSVPHEFAILPLLNSLIHLFVDY